MRGMFITGTGTEIGKTMVTSILSFGLNRLRVPNCPIKPIGSGGIRYQNQTVSEDALIYRQITKIEEPLDVLNPFCLDYPASPHLAANMQNCTIPIDRIIKDIKNTANRFDAVLIEGVGGWLVPIYQDMLVRDYSKKIGLPILLVSPNELGTINHTLLTIESIRNSGQTLAGIVFTDSKAIDDSRIHQDNIQTIERLSETPILGSVPHLPSAVLQGTNSDSLWDCIKDNIRWDLLIQLLHIPVKP